MFGPAIKVKRFDIAKTLAPGEARMKLSSRGARAPPRKVVEPRTSGGAGEGSVRTVPAGDCRPRLPQDEQVERERPVLDVAKVQPDRFLPGQIGPAVDLPQAGH